MHSWVLLWLLIGLGGGLIGTVAGRRRDPTLILLGLAGAVTVGFRFEWAFDDNAAGLLGAAIGAAVAAIFGCLQSERRVWP
jgi:hypothetical protein